MYIHHFILAWNEMTEHITHLALRGVRNNNIIFNIPSRSLHGVKIHESEALVYVAQGEKTLFANLV